ncbi:hypothetical protein V8F33_013464 [Rhypophila sp. PSN 637]
MQLSNIITVLAMAMAAVQAAPNPSVLKTRTNPDCSAGGNGKKVCCVGLTCIVTILTGVCSDSTFCCETNNNVGALVSINALNCVKLL